MEGRTLGIEWTITAYEYWKEQIQKERKLPEVCLHAYTRGCFVTGFQLYYKFCGCYMAFLWYLDEILFNTMCNCSLWLTVSHPFRLFLQFIYVIIPLFLMLVLWYLNVIIVFSGRIDYNLTSCLSLWFMMLRVVVLLWEYDYILLLLLWMLLCT